MAFDKALPVKNNKSIEEAEGKLSADPQDDKLMRSVLKNDKNAIDDGNLLEESFNQGLGSFSPNLFYEQIVQNYKQAERVYGKRLLQLVSGYAPEYIQRNVKIPEFQRELKENIENTFRRLKKEKSIDNEGFVTEKGMRHASLVILLQELDSLHPRGFFGEKERKRQSSYGLRDDVRDYRKGDRFRDLNIRRTIRKAAIRGHDRIFPEDLQMYSRKAKGKVTIIFALDASSSMKGEKLRNCKRAGISLAFNATQNKDEVGIMVFGSEIKTIVKPTTDFDLLMREIVTIKASTQTNIKETIERSVSLFPNDHSTKHLVLITDSKPTSGNEPERETRKSIAVARAAGITTSVIGINLDKDSENLARQLVELGDGMLYSVKELKSIGLVVMQDYLSVR